MRKFRLILAASLLATMLSVHAQTAKTISVTFRNAPVLFKQGGKMVQQIIADIKADQPAELIFSVSGEKTQKDSVKKGDNLVLLTVSAVTTPKKVDILIKGDPNILEFSV